IIASNNMLNPLSLHDALPIWVDLAEENNVLAVGRPQFAIRLGCNIGPLASVAQLRGFRIEVCNPHLRRAAFGADIGEVAAIRRRSEEHTSELQSLAYLVCRLL